jgi:hypothetical protein
VRRDLGRQALNTFIAAGVVVGVTLGFLVGRRWAEYFRAADDARRVMNARKNYRGRSTVAFVVGGLLILGLALFFGGTAP